MKKIVFAILASVVVIVSSCSKYADGPKFSLRTKVARLTGHWAIEKVLVNGNDVTSTYTTGNPSFAMDILKSKRWGVQGAYNDYGSWSLGEDKDDITLTSELPGSQPKAYRILKLENKELWWKYTDPAGLVTETHFKQ